MLVGFESRAGTIETAKPTVMTQAITEIAPIIPLDRVGETGARTPSGLKRVRSAARRHEVLSPRRAAAKTLVKNAIAVATSPNGDDPQVALAEALSALDLAAKTGAIHRNAAARRKSRLTIK